MTGACIDEVTLNTDDGIATDEDRSIVNIELVAVPWLTVNIELVAFSCWLIAKVVGESLVVAVLESNGSSSSQAASSSGNEVENWVFSGHLLSTFISMIFSLSSSVMISNESENSCDLS